MRSTYLQELQADQITSRYLSVAAFLGAGILSNQACNFRPQDKFLVTGYQNKVPEFQIQSRQLADLNQIVIWCAEAYDPSPYQGSCE